ncbi:hypothetical protein G3570_03215 [Balneolaceae bacterium YR4-1]|uniref:C2H2-type domain-containing protein n=1 Tax=Halalkalibaculum roseum TaxID=2709311 RepID=A0A6M1SU05_9BACT|nr:hypothetical protein [Halalkalibaculum roseum]NGP75626.1 hypothetical protein [Halalkalibaculum roseum]
MIEEIEKPKKLEEDDQLTCPECGKGFQDYRGLTSHARHKHEIGRREITESIRREKLAESNFGVTFKFIAGITTTILTLLIFGKIK